MVCKELADYLRFLADKYENESFFDGDPSFSLKKYSSITDTECAAFIAAVLAFGRRDQFLKKIEYIFSLAESYGSLSGWLKDRIYLSSFLPDDCKNNIEKKFYRFYSYADFIQLFDALSHILQTHKTLGEFFKSRYGQSKAANPDIHLSSVICLCFKDCKVVPAGSTSCSNKRINMFLRWMVRTGSPVDTGLWTWYSPEDLLMPLDTHVMQEAVNLGLIPPESRNTLKTAVALTNVLKEVFPHDPVRGDFALFGLGVDKEREKLADFPKL